MKNNNKTNAVSTGGRGGRGKMSGIGSSSGGNCGRQNFIRELDDWEKELKKLEEEMEKDLNEATANKDDNSEEIISSYTTKITSADVISIKYKIEMLTKYQIKRSLDLYIMKADKILTEIKDSNLTNIWKKLRNYLASVRDDRRIINFILAAVPFKLRKAELLEREYDCPPGLVLCSTENCCFMGDNCCSDGSCCVASYECCVTKCYKNSVKIARY
ncbi:hypothetical protein Glove_29g163 [Diversispora epigaea]|uniref:Uncharacterized protein n=1 Tax=Diversispora epigaea TaxID=1348612 RepID=A0A397JHL3_9GLOM|nr:hypothetical protein Glove_29g163 [Diversispora epigaea]